MNKRRMWFLAAAIVVALVLPRIRIHDPTLKFEIYAGVVLVLAFVVAGEGHAILFWGLVAFFGLAVLSIFLIHPYAVLTSWFVCLVGAIAICTGAGLRYLFDLVRPLHRYRIVRYPIEFGDRMTRRCLKGNESWLFAVDFWLESLVLNTLSAVCLSFIVCSFAAHFFSDPASSLGLHAFFEKFRPGWLVPASVLFALFLTFFSLFMWRSVRRIDTDDGSGPSA